MMWQQGVEGYPLPSDGAKITSAMLDSKSDLQDLIDDSKRWKGYSMVDNMRPPDDEGDWDARYSQQAESHANLIWDMPLSKIYETCSDNRVSMWCEWIQEAVFTQWLEDQGSE